jgi:hypothetical protein
MGHVSGDDTQRKTDRLFAESEDESGTVGGVTYNPGCNLPCNRMTQYDCAFQGWQRTANDKSSRRRNIQEFPGCHFLALNYPAARNNAPASGTATIRLNSCAVIPAV